MLAPWLEPVARFLNDHLGWFFLFAKGNVSPAGGGTIFTAGVVLAVMILPIITSVTREVFSPRRAAMSRPPRPSGPPKMGGDPHDGLPRTAAAG